MMRTEASPAKAIAELLALAVVAGFVLNPSNAAAQTPDHGPRSHQWDMWNPNWMQRHMWGPGHMGSGMRQRMTRHWIFMHQGIPDSYNGARNPLSPDAKNVGEGRTLYQEKCAPCHGKTGMGDGEGARSLSPPQRCLPT